MNTLVFWAAGIALACFTLGFCIATLRLMLGPDITDRILGLDTMYVNGLLMLLTLGVLFGLQIYFDIALLMSLFGFVGSVAMAKFLVRGEVIEP